MMTLFFIFVVGAAIGSFLNVLIDRLPREESIMGRSHCDFCKHTLSPLDLVPLISFVFLNGKCRYCKKRLSYQYPFIEFLTGCVFVLSWSVFSPGPDFLAMTAFPVAGMIRAVLYLVLAAVFMVIFFTDLKYRIIPDEMQIVFVVVSLLVKLAEGYTITTLGFALAEGALVMLPILLLYLFTRGRGMGFGDVKLAFNIGFFMGVKGGLLSLYFGFILGAVIGILLVVTKQRKLKSKIAFGPFLLMGVWVVLAFQQQLYGVIREWYGI